MNILSTIRRSHRLSLAITFTFVAVAGSLQAKTDLFPELLAKYNFEGLPSWVPGWGAGHGSTYQPATGWRTPFRVELDADDPHSGMHALRIELKEASGKEKIVHAPAIKVASPSGDSSEERKICIHLHVRTHGLVENGVGIRLLERDAENTSIRLLDNEKSLVHVPNSSEWVELNATGTLDSRTASITLMIVAYQSEVPATLWVDDISVELLTTSELR
ncbi:hypothetical protein SH580_16900 [Coraliomargarita algicola]|uniref:Secreted protein n=1 Tax=Coraliomargarita algicola TaxID=3092156 RepID=A0ABZ0RK04_9BACT|nr:hypothetical protein [Coraliomargarita sp. J2-16]WPJ95105.1 hypothetical protein SH580_16900 [Coraliomargarita sp. J2-16]